ncbi:MAG: hypothetical protein A3I44_04665 [Candidatus Sungbacteria bacterium RIFCSPLOWO2_02_FULL_51_17]|uniref:Uncharacterized protein n=1 Tax=Candidatus Sungbacteria bacterium RIFCSPHIGHO2_02_FULL_51_29 TaxID=1802273 RepID=A0A1G2KVK2_9BACT|nr:MAG: hypothetical protein A2676_05390 [Candidatus Sungbacteria bacterium RIFCSPHIGHO2_01_FULL_51_22]OHA03433.1 MAG: hypothetical protein A3C16_00120 [Candidatus Sungbacteria bacterium RIFCSPHIGHO2_02_FULL_51_29]OHA07908.1 MAG: hypothetical protein A3B29_04990 [Candidatus Sungbacteria bacterium RIFCSPLOWO2_01_FULL_51_34]OHA12462.1 MAG: hypothetical protein A3I44_04665 [Candidatus Sungbacteria bacterium RIFCSPLOWO2_02_FULL_51_17]
MCDAHIENCVARSWNKRTFVDFLDLLARDAKEQGIEIRDASWRLRIILNSGDHRQYALGAAKKLPHGWVVHNKEIMPERKL